jgi:hypothetical protein
MEQLPIHKESHSAVSVPPGLAPSQPHPEQRAIRRLIRHRVTRQYFQNGAWTDSAAEATVFRDSLDAMAVCARYGLKDVELDLRVGTGTCDLFSTPIR